MLPLFSYASFRAVFQSFTLYLTVCVFFPRQFNLIGIAFVPVSAETRSLTSLKVLLENSTGESQLLCLRPYESESGSANEQQYMSVGGGGEQAANTYLPLSDPSATSECK